jgi:chromosome segregation ATPase
MNSDSIRLKRQATIKTVVTNEFRQRAKDELANEINLIESQLGILDTQYQQTLQQLEKLGQQGQNVNRQLEQLHQEVQTKRNQLTTLKVEVSKQLGNLDRVDNGALVVTGILESFVDVKVGENIYDRVQGTEVIIENGRVKEIRG